MPEVTPGAYTDYGDPLRIMPVMPAGTAPSAGTPAFIDREGLKHQCFYMADLDNGNTWRSQIPGIVNMAFARDEFLAAEFADARLTTAASGLVAFTTSGNSASGFLHVWSLPTGTTSGAVMTDAPVAYVDNFDPDRSIPVFAAGAVPSASGAIDKDGLTLRVLRFDNVSNADTFPSNIRGIVSLATAKIGTSTLADARLTTAETGLVTFAVQSGTPDFFLYVWSRA